MTINNFISINGTEVRLDSLTKQKRDEIIRKMNIKALESINYKLKEETA